MTQQPPGSTLQATVLVHEAYLRLSASDRLAWKDRAHFFRMAAEAMRCVLVDHARGKARAKRGGGAPRVSLDGLELASETEPETLLLIDEVLEKLAAEHPAKAELVKLRFFTGLGNEEAAQALGISKATLKRHWAFARAWLLREIRELNAKN